MFEKLTTVTFISSESCNLNCSYCEIAKNASPSHLAEAEKVREALGSGIYFNRYRELFANYHIDVDQINRVELWGQEPTLTLNEFASQVPDIFDWLKKAKTLFFSTNGVAYGDRIINLAKVVSNYCEVHEDREIDLIIQISFDGFHNTQENRGIDPEIIFTNFKNIIKAFNEIKFNKRFNVAFRTHGVITLENMKEELQSNEDLYWTETDKKLIEVLKLNKNLQVKIEPFSAFVQAPYNATQGEGQIVSKYFQRIADLCTNRSFALVQPFTVFHSLVKAILLLRSSLVPSSMELLDNIVDTYNFDCNDISDSDYIGVNYGCGIGVWDIKMRYDGTLIYCQNAFFSLDPKDLEGKEGIAYDMQRYQLNNPIFQPNLFDPDRKKIETFLAHFDTAKHYTETFSLINVINLMYLLAQTNQIDSSYKTDSKKLLRHAMYIAFRSQCYYNNIIDTSSMYCTTLGAIRFYCNGAIDIIEKHLEGWDNTGEIKRTRP